MGARVLRVALALLLVFAVAPDVMDLAPPIGGVLASPLAAQEPERVERETQIPIDAGRGLIEIDAQLRRELELFPEIDGFVAARLFETEAGARILEISFRRDGELVRERRTLTADGLSALRDRVEAAFRTSGATTGLDRSGRGGLVLAQTVLGLAYHGWALPAALDIESDRGAVATYLLTAGASFVVPYYLTRDVPVTRAHRDAAVWGGTRGILYGMVLGDMLDGDAAFLEERTEPVGDPSQGDVETTDADLELGLGVLTSVAGSLLGYRAVGAADADQGDVALWSTAGDFALAYGFGTSYVLGLYDDETCGPNDFEPCEGSAGSQALAHGVSLGLGLVGIYGAHRWADVRDYTVGDARVLLSAGLLGGQLALPIGWALFESEEGGEQAVAATTMIGSAAGLWAGDRLLRDRSTEGDAGLMVQAGHLAGGLLASGITYLADDDADELVYITTSALGSLAGAWLTYNAVAAPAGRTAAARGGAAEPDFARREARPGPRFELHPSNALLSLAGGSLASPSGRRPPRALPLVTIRF